MSRNGFVRPTFGQSVPSHAPTSPDTALDHALQPTRPDADLAVAPPPAEATAASIPTPPRHAESAPAVEVAPTPATIPPAAALTHPVPPARHTDPPPTPTTSQPPPPRHAPSAAHVSRPPTSQPWNQPAPHDTSPAAVDDDPRIVARERAEQFDLDDVFQAATIRHLGEARTGLAQVIVTMSGSGGVGKTTTSIALAQRAATRGQRVVLFDADLAQGDVGSLLRVATDATLPSVYDGTVLADGDIRSCLITPDQMKASRDARLQDLRFTLVQAPDQEELLSGRVRPANILPLVNQAREMADLVIIDTPPVEPDDPRQLMHQLIYPLLGRDGWALSVTSMSAASVKNLLRLMGALQARGVPASHILSVLNQVPREVDMRHDRLTSALEDESVHLGHVWSDSRILVDANRGEPASEHPGMAWIADQVLDIVLNMPAAAPHPDQPPPKRRFGLGKRGK